MDRIFYFGENTEQLPRFLERLGYFVQGTSAQKPVPDVLGGNQFDLILIDGRITPEAADLCKFFRAQEDTRQVPIVCITDDLIADVEEITALDRIEVVQSQLSIGTLASRIATQIRLRKVAGDDGKRGTLAEINAALREHNARFQKDLEEARAIQQNLLPRILPADPRFQIAVSYEPLEQVGGDWYFVDYTENKRLLLNVADVSGHGLAAAFIGSMTKLAMVAAEQDKPDKRLAVMNHYLAPQLPMGRFITMGTCVYDPETGGVQWARAGHGPALILRADSRQVIQLWGEGFPLGFVGETQYELTEDVLMPGDVLLLYTDGVTEAQNRAMDQYGIVRLSQALSRVPERGSAGEMVKSILSEFSSFLEGRLLKDDVTLLLLKRER